MTRRIHEGTTHWEGCEAEHHECALARLEDARQRVRDLEAALRALVRECTPPTIPADGGRIYGVRMPSRNAVDAARTTLAGGSPETPEP